MKGPTNKGPDVPTSEEFTRTLGQVAWLTTLSRPHLGRPMSYLRDMVIAPLVLKQVRVFLKGKQPLAAITWAYASEAVKAKVAMPPFVMALEDWRSGAEVVVIECISPLLDPQIFITQFMNQVENVLAKKTH